MATLALYEKLKEFGEKEYGITVKFKNESGFMKVLSKILFFNKNFMTTYASTIGSTVYFPSRSWVAANPTAAAIILAHELVHVADARKLTAPVFALVYLAPQLFSLFALFAVVHSLWWLLCLLFLLPWPALGRAILETRAYSVSCMMHNAITGWIPDYTEKFTSPAYYYMWPFAKDMHAAFATIAALVKQNKLNAVVAPANDILAIVTNFYTNNRRT